MIATKYILKRITISLISFFLVITIVFFIMHSMPSNPFLSGKTLNPKVVEYQKERYGLNKSILNQYIDLIKQVFKFDFGESIFYTNQLVSDLLLNGLKTSILIGSISAMISITIGLFLGIVCAKKNGKLLDKLIIFITNIFISLPSFIIGTLLLWFMGVKLNLFPTRGDSFEGLILPIITLSFYPIAYITRIMRTSMINELSEKYVLAAKARGISKNRILYKHVLKNAIKPLISYAGTLIAYLITGGFVVEKIFSIPGIGVYFITSIQNSDYPLIIGTTTVLTVIIISMTLLCDLLYKYLDNRIKIC